MSQPDEGNETREREPMASDFKDLERERSSVFSGVMKLLAYSTVATAIVLLLLWIFLV